MSMRTFRRVASLAIAAVLGGTVLSAVPPAPPAHAADPASAEVLVVNQETDSAGGCIDYPGQLVTANPFTGVRMRVIGRPSNINGQLSEAKPILNNHKVVVLWAGHDDARPGGIGVYRFNPPGWTTAFTLLPQFQTGNGNAHSVAYLSNGYFAVALVGPWADAGEWGWVVLLNSAGQFVNKQRLAGAHGVEWDERMDRIVAVGDNEAAVFKLDANNTLQPATTSPSHKHPLPTGGGHDIRRRRANGGVEFFVTTLSKVYRYNPYATANWFQPATGMTKTNAAQSPLENDIKSIDEGWDGQVTYNQYGVDRFYFLDGRNIPASSSFCYHAYKTGRWLFPPGSRVQPEDVDENSGGGGGSGTFNTPYTLLNMNPWWIEMGTTTEVSQVDVIFNGGEDYFPLVRQSSTTWGASPPDQMGVGTWLRFVARRADGASAASTDFQWQVTQPANTVPGWLTPWTLGTKNEWWLEVDVADEATKVEVKIQNGAFTPLDRTAWGTWAKSLHAPPGSDVVFRAYRADDARAYSPLYVW